MQDEDLANRVVELLNGRAVATAESSTAGRIAEVLAWVGEGERLSAWRRFDSHRVPIHHRRE